MEFRGKIAALLLVRNSAHMHVELRAQHTAEFRTETLELKNPLNVRAQQSKGEDEM